MAEILKPVKEGKVREIYDNGDSIIMVATDRISCFDVILKNYSEILRQMGVGLFYLIKKSNIFFGLSSFWCME